MKLTLTIAAGLMLGWQAMGFAMAHAIVNAQ